MGARKHLNFSKYFEMRRLFLLAFVLRGYNLDTSDDVQAAHATRTHAIPYHHRCCDGKGAVLDIVALYKYDRCEWTFKEKDGTTREVLTPSQNITVSCIVAEYRINVHCSDPKCVFLTCFNMVNETNQIVNRNIRADNHGPHKFRGIYLVLLLLVVSCAGLFCWKKIQIWVSGGCHRESSDSHI